MKRVIAILIVTTLALSCAFSYTDSFTTMTRNEKFLSLLDVIKNGKSIEEAEAAYNDYLATEPSDLDRSRCEYHMVRYFKDMGNEAKANEHLEKEKAAYAEIEGENDLRLRTAESDMVAAEYYITGKMNTGMKNSDLTKALYKDYPEEYYIALQEAFRLLYTPPIAGGSTRKALRILNALEPEVANMSTLDQYSFYVAKAMALSKDDEFDESDKYLELATNIYTFDDAIDEIRSDNRRGRR